MTVVAAALLIQIADMAPTFGNKFRFYMDAHPISSMWDDEELRTFVQGNSRFEFLYTENDITLETGYFGYLSGMSQNNFYFARDIDNKVREDIRADQVRKAWFSSPFPLLAYKKSRYKDPGSRRSPDLCIGLVKYTLTERWKHGMLYGSRAKIKKSKTGKPAQRPFPIKNAEAHRVPRQTEKPITQS